jgi:hypothetical protein
MPHQMRWLAAVLLILLAVPASAGAPVAPDPDPHGGWVTYHWAGAFSAYNFHDLKLSYGGRLEFSADYMNQPVRVAYDLTSEEMAYVRSIIAPISTLEGTRISRMADDVGRSSLRVRLPDGRVGRLDWELTDQPDLLVWTGFVRSLAEKERYRLALRLDNLHLARDIAWLSDGVGRLFRPEELRDQLWAIVEQRPLIGYGPLKATFPLGDAVSALARWDSPEEWAGHVLKATEGLPPDDKLRVAAALSQYVTNFAKDRPWGRLTPFFVAQLRYARSLPAVEPLDQDWRYQARVHVEAAVRALADPRTFADPRAKAALGDAQLADAP